MDDDPGDPPKSLRERFGVGAEERLGKALSELLDSPLFTGAIGRAFDAREKAAQAQEVAMSALNLPSAADIERLTRRLRAVSQRLEAIEEGVEHLDSSSATGRIEARLSAIEAQLQTQIAKLDSAVAALEAAAARDARGSAGAAHGEPRAAAKKATPAPARRRATTRTRKGAS